MGVKSIPEIQRDLINRTDKFIKPKKKKVLRLNHSVQESPVKKIKVEKMEKQLSHITSSHRSFSKYENSATIHSVDSSKNFSQ